MKILIIQTAFPGDVILATPVLEKLHRRFPDAEIDFLLRKGNEGLFAGHPFLHRIIIWDKMRNKLPNLLKVIGTVRREKYDIAVNLHRFASSGLVMWLSRAGQKAGFDKNPFSFCYTQKVKHTIGDGRHETERNLELIEALYPNSPEDKAGERKDILPRLYPPQAAFDKVKNMAASPYLCIAPASVWFTKQFPARKWIELINLLRGRYTICLIGSAADYELCNSIKNAVQQPDRVLNLAGSLTMLESAALMKGAKMNFVNDSAPLHLASAVNAPVNAIFCSTIPAFGFGPLSAKSIVTQTTEELNCRPCGLHGKRACPQKHFRCAESIPVQALVNALDD